MRAQTFWKTVVDDRADFLDRLIRLLTDHGIRYCLVGGQAVNADIARLVEAYPALRERVPAEILARLV